MPKPVDAYVEQDVIFDDVWRVSSSIATFPDDPGDPDADPPIPPTTRQGFLVEFAYNIRDENGVVRRQGTYSGEIEPLARFNQFKSFVNPFLPDINTSEGM